jgi:pyrimidine operon attenuation protein/uracil phosphoribosyltransferase
VIEFGRPAAIRLAALIERDDREFPIKADYIGEHLDVKKDEIVAVLMEEADGVDCVNIEKMTDHNR